MELEVQSPGNEGKKQNTQQTSTASKHPHSLDYGCLGFRPQWLQWMNRPVWLMVVMCVAATAQSIAVGGLLGVNMSTIERRFNFSSGQSSLIPSLYEFAGLLVVLLVGYIGGRQSRPLWVGLGLLLLAVGSILFALPHFVTGPYNYDSTAVTEENICYGNRTDNSTSPDECDQESENLSGYLGMFIVAYCIMGVGSVPLYSIGLTYMDDVIRRDRAALYIGIFYAWTTIGPAAAFAGAGFLLDIYTDVDRGIDPDISRSDPRWVGAWWIGYVAVGCLSLVAAIPMLGFPKDLPGAEEMRAKRKSEAHKGEEVETFDVTRSKGNELIRSLKTILYNPTFLCLCVGALMDSLVVTGLTNYGPMFVEYQFSLSAGVAGALFGLVAVPGGAGGSFVGSVLVKRFNMSCRQLLKWMFILTLAGFTSAAMFFIQCENPRFAGVNQDYRNRWFDQYNEELDAVCNADCECSRRRFSAVCGTDNILYFSPCYAGCQDWVEEDGSKVYYNCSCIEPPEGLESLARLEPCDSSCDLMPLFMVLFLITMFMTFVTGFFNISATLRCVPAREKSFAMSINYFTSKLFGSLPGPLIFGAAMDLSCVLWGETCEGPGSCLYYKNSSLAFAVMFIGAGVKGIATIFYFIGWRIYKPPPDSDKDTDEAVTNTDKDINVTVPDKDISVTAQSNGHISMTSSSKEMLYTQSTKL